MSGLPESKPPCPRDLRMDVDRRGSASIVRLAGSAHMSVATTLREQLVGLIDQDTPRLVLDLADLEFINSVGLGAIIAAHLRCRHYNGDVKIVAPRPEIEHLLSVTKLTRILPVHPSVDAALGSGQPEE